MTAPRAIVTFAAASLLAGAAQAQQSATIQSFRADDGLVLLNPPPYPHNRVGEVNRDGSNGRIWVGRGFIGGERTYNPLPWGGPGPEKYGAPENDVSIVYTRDGLTQVAFTPWVRIGSEDRGPSVGLEDFERARSLWLREQGYTGGVRTVVNPASMGSRAVASRDEIRPRGTIKIRKRRGSGSHPLMVLRDGDRVSMPNLLGGGARVRVAMR
ncbi:MAG: hypothetical protein AAGG07_04020 [Planctomycetota bacterium]